MDDSGEQRWRCCSSQPPQDKRRGPPTFRSSGVQPGERGPSLHTPLNGTLPRSVIPSLALRGSGAHVTDREDSLFFEGEPGGKRRSNVRAAVVRSGEIDQLLWSRKIDNTTGRAARAADVISQTLQLVWCQWCAGWVIIAFFFSSFTAPSVARVLGAVGRLSVSERCCRD